MRWDTDTHKRVRGLDHFCKVRDEGESPIYVSHSIHESHASWTRSPIQYPTPTMHAPRFPCKDTSPMHHELRRLHHVSHANIRVPCTMSPKSPISTTHLHHTLRPPCNTRLPFTMNYVYHANTRLPCTIHYVSHESYTTPVHRTLSLPRYESRIHVF